MLTSIAKKDDIRTIAHLDMDAFFASVELLRYPELKGLPVVVGGGSASKPVKSEDGRWIFSTLANYAGRGVVTTCTYEARVFGIHSALGLMKAAKLAPQAILLPSDFNSYKMYSHLFKAAVAKIAPTIEDRGIDEIYMDLSGLTDDFYKLISKIQNAVYEATGLSCSIGVAPNKMLAKICSDLEKPKGLTIIGTADIETKIWPLSVKKINGIGPKATEKLAKLNIHTIQDLAKAELELLQLNFGRTYSAWLHQVAWGIDERPITTHTEPKSISRETTFKQDLHVIQNRKTLTEVLNQLCEKVADDLIRKGYKGKTIGVKIRFSDFTTITRDITLQEYSYNLVYIRAGARKCLTRISFEKKIRLIGIRVTGLEKLGNNQIIESTLQGQLAWNFG